MGNTPRLPPRAKKSKGKETMGMEEQVVTGKAKTFERGECSKNRYSTDLSHNNVDSDEHDDKIMENDEHVDNANCTACDDKIVETDLPADNLAIGVVYFPMGGGNQTRKKRINLQQASKLFKGLKYFGVTVRQLKVWDDTDESEGGDDDVNPSGTRPVKIQDPVCSLNRNPAETEDGEQFLVPSPTPPERNKRRIRQF
ncbi:UNVERIFIED_CONTAM: hypothetical protein Sindi_2037800 [Sesamum indicum]